MLVFTAGLLMRLTKLGVYSLAQASLLVLHDAFSSVRNHPMNTLVREYYWKLPGGDAGRPKVGRSRMHFGRTPPRRQELPGAGMPPLPCADGAHAGLTRRAACADPGRGAPPAAAAAAPL